MDDNFIYYLILGAIYLISRMLKKKKPVKPITPRQTINDNEGYQEPIPQRPTPQKPTSFEDLLKEISQEFAGRREPEPRISVVEEPTEEIEPVVVERELTREEKYVKKRHKETAEEDRKKEIKRLLEEEEEHKPHAVLELLQEEGGAANAIILSEIMNRKY